MRMSPPVARLRLIPVLAVMLLGACQAVVEPAPTPTSVPGSALEACHPPATADKGGETLTFQWRTSVEMIVPNGEILFLTSGLDDAICEAFRSADGTWGDSVLGIGRLDPAAPAALTYDMGMEAIPANPRIIAVGRAPVGSTTIQATAADGGDVVAVLRNGFYVVRVDSAGPLTQIVADDDTGVEIARLDDSSGLQAGITSQATSP